MNGFFLLKPKQKKSETAVQVTLVRINMRNFHDIFKRRLGVVGLSIFLIAKVDGQMCTPKWIFS